MSKKPESLFFLLALASLAGCRDPGAGAIGTERTRQALTAYAPAVAVVLCRESYDAEPRVAQMSSQALVGLAGLVGVPYDTLTLEQLLALPPDAHSSLWISHCPVLSDGRLTSLAARLTDHLARGGSVLLDGPLGIYRPGAGDDPMFRGSDDTEEILQVEYRGWADVAGFTVRTAEGAHPLSSRPGWAPGTTLTQGLAEGTDLLDIAGGSRPGAHTLLQLSGGGDRQPYAVVTQPASGRVLAISGYGQDSGAASPFRNDPPAGFFDNLLLPRLIDATSWLLGGGGPVVGLQASHAPLTAIVRLDGDVSDSPDASAKTIDYLLELGRQTGVATAYGIVSSFAESVDWDGFSLAKMEELERLGGAVASHSHTHNDDMSRGLDEAAWDTEVRHSLQTIREHFTTPSFRPPVEVFINPGETIDWADYPRFFDHVRATFTHGFELSVPYTTGVSGFDRPPASAPVALFGDTPVPDFHWFYDPDWRYSVGEATELQRRILGYFQRRVGRGAIYNQMWHDYGIAGNPPDHDPGAGPFDALYDAVRDHFGSERVYAPSIAEAAAKLVVAQRSRFTAQISQDGNEDGNDDGKVVNTTLDMSRLSPAERESLAGMGLRIDQPGSAIVAVEVDGAPHPAFTTDTVILPAATNPSLLVKVTTGDPTVATRPRLTYLSKAPAAITAASGSLRVQLARPGQLTRFCLVPPGHHVLIRVDRYAPEGNETCGRLAHGSSTAAFEARALDAPGDLSIVAADRRILAQRSNGLEVTLDVAAGQAGDRLTFRATAAPAAVLVDGRAVTPIAQDGAFAIPLDTVAPGTVTFSF